MRELPQWRSKMAKLMQVTVSLRHDGAGSELRFMIRHQGICYTSRFDLEPLPPAVPLQNTDLPVLFRTAHESRELSGHSQRDFSEVWEGGEQLCFFPGFYCSMALRRWKGNVISSSKHNQGGCTVSLICSKGCSVNRSMPLQTGHSVQLVPWFTLTLLNA